jgi:hypothetical protein
MSSPVVVQGTKVETPFGASPQPTNLSNQQSEPANDDKAAKTGCKDPIFAVLFYINLFAIVGVAAVYGPAAFEDTATATYGGYIAAVVVTAVISLLASGIGMLLMMRFPETIIKVSLIFVVVMSLVMCILSFLTGNLMGGIIGLVFFAIGVCYARAVWSRIPFATVNLVTSITAIKANFGVTFFAYLFALFGVGWAILWTIAFAGVFENTYDCNDLTGVCTDPNYGYLFLLFLSFFFTHQVLQVGRYVSWTIVNDPELS